MGFLDSLILLAVGAYATFVIVRGIRGRKTGTCTGCCSSCRGCNRK